MNDAYMFAAGVAPSLILRDPLGRLYPVASADLCQRAIELADGLHAIGGKNIVKTYEGKGLNPVPSVLHLVYFPHDEVASGASPEADVQEAVRVIATSDVTLVHHMSPTEYRISGTRCVVYPEQPDEVRHRSGISMLVSRQVWFNKNRSTANFPASRSELDAFLEDINRRLPFGHVELR